MSLNTAMALPARTAPLTAPLTVARRQPRRIEIDSSRDQRRARPKIIYAIVAVAGLFVILIAQLLLSILLSDGAYQIAALKTTQHQLTLDKESLIESVHVLGSPQNLATQAQTLGMVVNTSDSGWLSLSGADSTVLKAPTAAIAASTIGTNNAGLIPNALLTPEVLASQIAAVVAAPGAVVAGAGAGAGAVPAPVAPAALPAPVTH